MDSKQKTTVTITTTVEAPMDRVWECWTTPEHITRWNFASDEWHCPSAVNDLKPGGHFSWRMEAKDGSMGFDYCGVYQQVNPNRKITCLLDDGRHVSIHFTNIGNKTKLTETFEVENTNTIDQQRTGWQAILDNFKKHVETTN